MGVPLTEFNGRELSWVTVNDNVMGGRSEGGFRIEAGILEFRGSTNTDGGGFSSIRTEPQPLGLAGSVAIRLRVRGDGRTYQFRLATEETGVAWMAGFETTAGEWTEVRLPFEVFEARWRGRKLDRPPPDPARVASLGLMIYDRRDGPFRLEVDWIRADGAFDMASFEWKRRPLVVFAPERDDPRLREQLRRVAADRAGFDERDMELVVVAPGRGLSREERQAVRRRLEVSGEAFAVCLVGKDGGVKRHADEPLTMAELFARIDSMPMRRDEMRERGR